MDLLTEDFVRNITADITVGLLVGHNTMEGTAAAVDIIGWDIAGAGIVVLGSIEKDIVKVFLGIVDVFILHK
jgi:hypothetical protein